MITHNLVSTVGSMPFSLGCGYGWHCRYAAEQGASKVVGIDISERLIEPVPSKEEREKRGWQNELRRPMMLILSARKKQEE